MRRTMLGGAATGALLVGTLVPAGAMVLVGSSSASGGGEGTASAAGSAAVVEGAEAGAGGKAAARGETSATATTAATDVEASGEAGAQGPLDAPRRNDSDGTVAAHLAVRCAAGDEPVAVTCRWEADGEAQAGTFRLWRLGPGGETQLVAEVEGTSFTDLEVRAGAEYTYAVEALDDAGATVAAGGSVSVTVHADGQHASDGITSGAEAQAEAGAEAQAESPGGADGEVDDSERREANAAGHAEVAAELDAEVSLSGTGSLQP